jgi:hypothetical protein
MDGDAKRMAMQTRAFMFLWQIWQTVSRLKRKVFKNFHVAQRIPRDL